MPIQANNLGLMALLQGGGLQGQQQWQGQQPQNYWWWQQNQMPQADLGSYIGNAFAHANTLSSLNRQSQYQPEAAMRIADINNQGANYRSLLRYGMLGKLLGSMGGLFGGGYGGGGGPQGFRSLDSPQQAMFTGGGGGAGGPSSLPPLSGSYAMKAQSSPTFAAMLRQRGML